MNPALAREPAAETWSSILDLEGHHPCPRVENAFDLEVCAAVFLPSENEWYKAAYYHPQAAGGPSDDYWQYATRSDTAVTSRPPYPFPGSVNYFNDDRIANGINGGYAVTQSPFFDSAQNYPTEVGTYGPDSESYYGMAD